MDDNKDLELEIDENAENNPFRDTNLEIQQDEAVETSVDEVDKLKSDLENLNNQYLRLAADFDNYRKRQVQERENLINFGKIEAFSKLIEVLDNFDRAEQSLKDNEDVNCVKDAFNVLHKQILDSLEKMGLSKIETVGELFDPNLHEAVMQTQTDEYPEETIIKELQKGYKMGDKVLRPSMVDVAVK